MQSEPLQATKNPAPAASQQQLTPFELLMLLDERPGYPMCFYLETTLVGSLNHPQLKAALALAAQRHPRMRSRVDHGPNGWQWVLTEIEPPLIIVMSEDHSARQIAFCPFRLQREPGIRVLLFEEAADRFSLVLQVHHSVCDGIAALEFLGDVWSIYEGGEPPRLRPGVIRSRRDSLAPRPPAKGADNQASASWTFASFLPAKLARSNRKQPAAASERPYQTTRLSRQETRAVQAAAAVLGTAVNDLTVAAAMRSICRWNSHKGRPAKAVRINMPVSLRPPGCREPATNRIGYAFLDRTAAACDSAVALAQSLAVASRWIQSTGAAEMFLEVLHQLARWPWLLRLLTRLPLSLSTAVVSNVGNIQARMRTQAPTRAGLVRPGSLTITSVVGVPPVRPGTALAVGVTSYAGELAVTTMADPAEFSDLDNASLGEMITAELRSFIEVSKLQRGQVPTDPIYSGLSESDQTSDSKDEASLTGRAGDVRLVEG
jgi:hypothetical protein